MDSGSVHRNYVPDIGACIDCADDICGAIPFQEKGNADYFQVVTVGIVDARLYYIDVHSSGELFYRRTDFHHGGDVGIRWKISSEIYWVCSGRRDNSLGV